VKSSAAWKSQSNSVYESIQKTKQKKPKNYSNQNKKDWKQKESTIIQWSNLM
jgi:hypothetical protein